MKAVVIYFLKRDTVRHGKQKMYHVLSAKALFPLLILVIWHITSLGD